MLKAARILLVTAALLLFASGLFHASAFRAQSFEKRFPSDDYQTSGLCDVVGDRSAVRLGTDGWSRRFV